MLKARKYPFKPFSILSDDAAACTSMLEMRSNMLKKCPKEAH
jgi:hypothetical protein